MPHYTRGPKSDHNFDNHPCVIVVVVSLRNDSNGEIVQAIMITICHSIDCSSYVIVVASRSNSHG